MDWEQIVSLKSLLSENHLECRFVSYLVANPRRMFSHDMAQIIMLFTISDLVENFDEASKDEGD